MKNYLFLIVLVGLTLACSKPETTELTLIRKPYQQSAFGDSLTILWRTDQGEDAYVKYKSNEHDWKTVKGISRSTNVGNMEHEVVLKDLPHNASFTYQIFNGDHEWKFKDEYTFQSQKTASDSVFTFFAVGDIGEPIETGGTPDLLAHALKPELDQMDFGLLLGDIIYPDGKSEDYDKNLFTHFDKVFPYIPVYPVLGNHDWHEPDSNYTHEWKLPGNEHWYSFDYANVHFTALDTKNGEMHLYDEQLAWLENDLKSVNDKDWKIVYLHHNGNSCTYKEDYEAVVSLYPIFEAYDVDLVLNGHAHTYERLNPMGAEGVVLDSEIGDKLHYDAPEGFISITVGSGGKLRGVGSDPKAYTPDPENCRHENLVAKAVHDWAYLQVAINGKSLKGKAISTEDQSVLDEFEVVK